MDSPFAVTGGALLKALVVGVLAASMGGCLGGGGGGGSGSDDGNATPPVVETPQPAEPADPMVARTLQGDFRGIELDGMRVFRGIRYAKPPEGELRFAAPVASDAHEGELELSETFGSACPQAGFIDKSVITSRDEDCLFLNVYVPEQPGEYPVMVWLHGGALLDGSAGDWMYQHPQRLVGHDVIVVTLNYRLGTLGFLPHEALGENNNNFGLQDQQLALRWVSDNIASFGGDSSNITLFGESAGGHSTMSHIAAPGSAGLFHKAIVQSGSYLDTQLPLKDRRDPDRNWVTGGQTLMADRILANTSCADLAGQELVTCLRAMDVDEIINTQMHWMVPVWDTPTLPVSIREAIRSGNFNKVPMMIGSNLNEGELYALPHIVYEPPLVIGDLLHEVGYYRQVHQLLGDHAHYDIDQIAADYLAKEARADSLRFFQARSKIETDYRYTCPNALQWSMLHDQDVPVWGYWFADEGAPGVPTTFGLAHDLTGAAHAYEVPYVMMPFEDAFIEEYGAGDAQIELAVRMTAYWANFAKYGEPTITDGTDTTGWPQYTKGTGDGDNLIIRLDAPEPDLVPISKFLETHNCNYWMNPPTRPVWVPVG